MGKEFTAIIEKGEAGFFIAEIIELPGCHTQAKTLDELLKRTKEAISLYLECEKEIPKSNFFGLQKIVVEE